MSATAPSAAVLSFPRADLRGMLNSALKRHRLPETWPPRWCATAAKFPEISADAALAFALDSRMAPQPIDFDKARGILLVGPAGAGKSAVAAKIIHAAKLAGRMTEYAPREGGLALFRTNSNPPELLTVMEADGFNPLNARAASAFSALGDIEGVETIAWSRR